MFIKIQVSSYSLKRLKRCEANGSLTQMKMLKIVKSMDQSNKIKNNFF